MSDKQHFTIVRNAGYTATEFKTRQRHNERQNENYHNGDIVAKRSELNHHYLQYRFPDGSPVTYEERFNQLLTGDIIAKRGLKPDAKVFAELVFGVNSEYFEQNGGYDYAVKFFDEAYRLAVKEVGDERYILSAVLHANERNKEISERLGHDVFHYHLHVMYVPVVEKKVYYRKDMKDKEKAGTLKEVIPQISHSKKWPIKVPVERDGKTITVNSYSLLQDRYHEHMAAAGFPDLQRGERGSTAEHLDVLDFKIQQDKKRLADVSSQVEKKELRRDKLDEQITVKEKAKATIKEVDSMGKPQTIGNGFIVTADELKKLKSLAKKGVGIDKRAEEYKEKIAALEVSIRDLKSQITSLESDVRVIARDRDTWKANYDRLWGEVKDFIKAIRTAPQRLLAFIRENIQQNKNQEVSR
ncbi:MAG: plasmid recombination protein [Oscillospiraceae bacterium]|nr:plasmid recombination protein [Oscillospiraceae bacterium]